MDLVLPIITAIVGVFAGGIATWLLQRGNRRRKLREQLAALRFEAQQNILWAETVFETRIYLRDGAWKTFMNEGYVAYVQAPLLDFMARAYERLHALNGDVHNMRLALERGEPYTVDSERVRLEFLDAAEGLVREIDKHGVAYAG